MLTFERLRQKPHIFKGFTGVTIEEFEELLEKAIPIWVERELARLDRPDRKRAIGGGNKPRFDVCGKLLITLVWLRLYLTMDALGFLFGVDKATVSRYTRAILPVLREIGEGTLGSLEPPERGASKRLDAVLEEHSDLFAFVDATEQWVVRSSDNETQREHYSGKKKRHTRKAQIVVNEDGVIRDVSKSVPGSVHDRKLFHRSGVAEKIPKGVVVGGDLGYRGIEEELPNHSVITPFKKPRGELLNAEQKWLNREFSSLRIIVENVIAQFKHFHALSERFRHSVDLWDDVFRSVLAIVNPRIKRRIALAKAL